MKSNNKPWILFFDRRYLGGRSLRHSNWEKRLLMHACNHRDLLLFLKEINLREVRCLIARVTTKKKKKAKVYPWVVQAVHGCVDRNSIFCRLWCFARADVVRRWLFILINPFLFFYRTKLHPSPPTKQRHSCSINIRCQAKVQLDRHGKEFRDILSPDEKIRLDSSDKCFPAQFNCSDKRRKQSWSYTSGRILEHAQ